MKANSLKAVEKLLRVVGVVSWLAVPVSVASQIYIYLSLQTLAGFHILLPFSLMKELNWDCWYLAQGAVALLAASVLAMVRERQTLRKQRADRLAWIATGALVAQGLTGLFPVFSALALPSAGEPVFVMAYGIFGFIHSLLLVTSPFLYAAIIFVLYRHFTSLVEMESELV